MAQLQEEGAAQKVLHVPLFLMSAVAVISASPVAPHLQKLRPLNRSYHRCDVRWVAHSFSRFGCRLRTTFMPRRMMNVHLLSSVHIVGRSFPHSFELFLMQSPQFSVS